MGAMNASSVQPVVAIERTIFYRERAAGMYSALPYAFGQVQSKDRAAYRHPFDKFHKKLVNRIFFSY